jgi:hypothetical protein
MTKEKLYRSTNGDYLYLFNWIDGGFNDVWAPTKKEAYKRIMEERKQSESKYPSLVKLRPDYKSLRRCTYSQYQEQNKLGWMLFN